METPTNMVSIEIGTRTKLKVGPGHGLRLAQSLASQTGMGRGLIDEILHCTIARSATVLYRFIS